jgi:iron complex outermembrane recepter protein
MTTTKRSAPTDTSQAALGLRLTAVAFAAAICAHGASAQEVAQVRAPRNDAAPAAESVPDTKHDLPTTKEVTSGQALQQSRDYSDVARRQAGVTQATSEGNSAPQYNIRGIRVNPQSNFRLDGGVAITSVQVMPTEDKERIETLKGANALMFGVASPAGIVNMIPKRAGQRDVTSLGISGNSFGQYGAHVDVGRRFGDQKQVGVRVNASGVHVENGVHDLGGRGDFGSVGLDWRVTPRLVLQGDIESYSRHTAEQPQIALAPAVDGVVPITRVPDPRVNLLGPGGDWAQYTPRSLNYQVRADYALNDQWSALLQAGRSDTHRHRHAVRIQGYNLTTGANGTVVDQITSNNNLNTLYRAELSGGFATGFMTHRLTAGVSQSERYSESDNLNLTLPQRQNIYNPVSIPRPANERPGTPNLSQNSVDRAVYAYDTIGLLPQVKLLAGVRITRNTDSVEGKPDNSSTVTSPAVGVLYDIRPSTTVYASYMSGLEAGQVAPGTAANSNFVLAPIVSKQKEIGIRDSSFAGLVFNAAYFDIRRPNAVIDPVTNIFGYSGNTSYRGVEATGRYTFLRNWTVNAGMQWLRAVQHSPSQPLIDGRTPENTPTWSGALGVAYRTPLPGLTVRAGLQTISRRAVNPQNQGYIPGYTLYAMGASYDTSVMGKHTTFQVQVDNVGNKRYWNSVANGLYGIGMDRVVRFNAKVDF